MYLMAQTEEVEFRVKERDTKKLCYRVQTWTEMFQMIF